MVIEFGGNREPVYNLFTDNTHCNCSQEAASEM